MSPQARVFLIFSLGYFASYAFRGVNLVLAPLLSRDIGVDPAGLGMLTSVYFLAFAGFQLPAGMLLDRFGPRRVEAGLLLVAAAGAAVFAVGRDLGALMIGRALIGIGVSACLTAAIKAITLWYPPDRLTVLSGAVFALGGLGGAATGTPVELALRVTGWRTIFAVLTIFTAAVAVLLLLVVPEHRSSREGSSFAEQWRGIRRILSSRLFWAVGMFTGLSNAVFLAEQGLWAGPFMREVEGLDARSAARLVVVLALAMVSGGFVLGWLARQLDRRGLSTYASAGANAGIFMLVQAVMLLDTPLPPTALWALYGFFGSAGLLGYAVLSGLFPLNLAGRVGTAYTLIVFALAFLFQVGFGALIDAWHRATGSPIAAAHIATWVLGLALQAIAAIPYLLARDAVRQSSR
ncbi:MAG TPA: MFS transporter [Alphaproteobacteria bacterium]|nr:MFS transporter [Alphaproteobacteria bacterium]